MTDSLTNQIVQWLVMMGILWCIFIVCIGSLDDSRYHPAAFMWGILILLMQFIGARRIRRSLGWTTTTTSA